MIIPPPHDEPLYDERELSYEEIRRITLYLGVKGWKCPECTTLVFGRCLECPYCRHKLGKHTPRPSHYTKERGA